MSMMVRIVGCGRWSMGDDAAGLLTAEELQRRNIANVRVVFDEAPGANLAGESDDKAELLIIVDAAREDGTHTAGRWSKFIVADEALGHGSPVSVRASKHRDERQAERVPMRGAASGDVEWRGSEAVSTIGRESVHALGVMAGLELASALGRLPDEVWLYVMYGRRFDRRFQLSREVETGIVDLGNRIEGDVREWIGARCTSCRS